jgi:hypothetical protein
VIALTLLAAALSPAQAADPSSGSLDPALGDNIAWVGTAPGGVSPGPQLQDHDAFCVDGTSCELFELELTGSPEDWQGIEVSIVLSWITFASDYDVYIHAGTPDGPIVDDSATGPTSSERLEIDPAEDGTGSFYVHVVYFAATAADQYNALARVVAKGQGLMPAPIDAGPPPRYQSHTPTQDQIAAGMTRNTQDEPNIGVNWQSEKVILQALLQTLRVGFDDLVCEQTPSSTWEDISPPTAVTSFDPILFTDHQTHRTFVSHLLLNPVASATSFTDDDGVLWIPSQGAGFGSGIDHQTLGGGPFAEPLPAGATYQNAVYYCAQDIAFANCALSVDGGLTFGPAVPMYSLLECAGLHGHVKVGPAGTVYVPNADCNGIENPNENAVVVSEDNGVTWEVRPVPGTVGTGGSDPSVGIAEDGTVYLGFVDGDEIPAVAVSPDRGRTWTSVYDVGSMVGVRNAVFPAMVAGDAGRAAMAFYGTTTGGEVHQFDSEGVWHLYVAHTYDDGMSWITVNATPDDPLQRGGIHLGGGSFIHRNLLDFFDADYDPQGRVAVGYADGCVGSCVAAPETARGNSYTAYGTIARQSGGRRLVAAFDPAEPTVPGAPRITATRDGATTTLAISLSEDGGAPVTSLEVYRAPQGEPEELLATVDGSTRVFVDPVATADVTYTYRVVAINALGESCGTNAVGIPSAGPSCAQPGIRVVSDASGDQDGAPIDEDMDIEWIALSEPDFGGDQKLVFTMKVASLETLPADRMWRLLWQYPDAPVAPNPPPTSAFAGRYYIGMTTDGAGVPSFEYGAVVDLTAVVINFLPPERLGDAAPESAFDPDGTITLVISNDKVGGPGPGDLIGGMVGRTYTVRQEETLRSDTAADTTASAETYRLSGNGPCPAPPEECFADDAEELGYGNGWHRVEYSPASGGHFTFKPGKNLQSGLSLDFDLAGGGGALVYEYGRSRRGGSADVYIDGVFQETIDYSGGTSEMHQPELGLSSRYEGLGLGPHVFELRNVEGAAYVDRICIEQGSSDALADHGPGQTTTALGVVALGGSLLETFDAPAGSEAVAVAASTEDGSPIRLLLVDPAGGVLEAVDSTDGLAVIERTVSATGLFQVQVLNLSLGAVEVWTAATPWLER